MEDLRQSPTGLVRIQHGGSDLVMFYAPFDHGSCAIDAEFDAAGHLLRVIVDLERDPFA